MATKYCYQDSVHNYYLGKSKVIKARTIKELNYKINEQRNKWREQEKREKKKLKIEEKIKKAIINTTKAKEKISTYQNILNDSLEKECRINFDNYKKKIEFKEFDYIKKEILLEDVYNELHVPQKIWLELLFSSLSEKRIKAENEARQIWQDRVRKINKEYNEASSVALKKLFYIDIFNW